MLGSVCSLPRYKSPHQSHRKNVIMENDHDCDGGKWCKTNFAADRKAVVMAACDVWHMACVWCVMDWDESISKKPSNRNGDCLEKRSLVTPAYARLMLWYIYRAIGLLMSFIYVASCSFLYAPTVVSLFTFFLFRLFAAQGHFALLQVIVFLRIFFLKYH